MVGPNLNFNVDVNRCFGGLRKSGRQSKTEIKKMKKEMEKLKAKRNDLKSKIEEAKREGNLASEEAKQWQRDLESLEDEVAEIFDDFKRIRFDKNIKIGAWGGSGRNEFDIGRSASRITKVRLFFGGVVDSLEVSYVDDGKNFETGRLGGQYGGSNQMFELSPGEYINSVFGSICEYDGEICISKLEFNTNFGKHHGPFGTADGNNFSVQFKDGRIVGLFGRFTKYINEIGVYLAPN